MLLLAMLLLAMLLLAMLLLAVATSRGALFLLVCGDFSMRSLAVLGANRFAWRGCDEESGAKL